MLCNTLSGLTSKLDFRTACSTVLITMQGVSLILRLTLLVYSRIPRLSNPPPIHTPSIKSSRVAFSQISDPLNPADHDLPELLPTTDYSFPDSSTGNDDAWVHGGGNDHCVAYMHGYSRDISTGSPAQVHVQSTSRPTHQDQHGISRRMPHHRQKAQHALHLSCSLSPDCGPNDKRVPTLVTVFRTPQTTRPRRAASETFRV